MSVDLFPQFTCEGSVPIAGKASRPCRNTVRVAGGRCWRHAEAPRVVRSVSEVYDALGNGRDPDVWPPGVSASQAIKMLVEERAALRDSMGVARAAGRDEERTAVVAWLRDVADDPETFVEEATLLRSTSNAIERGEHRREEKP
jgi:hypothetical protein